MRLFGSTEREIAILSYSVLFLAGDTGILRILADKGRSDVTVRIALGDPDGPSVAECGEEGIGDAMPANIRSTARSRATENIEIRLHRTVLYNSISARMTNSWSTSTPTAPSMPRRHPYSA